MAGNTRDVELNIIGRNKAKKATDEAGDGFDRLARKVKGLGKGFAGFARNATKAAGGAALLAANTPTLVSGAIAFGAAAVAAAKGAAGWAASLAPVLTSVPALAAGLQLVKRTLASVGPAFGRAVAPIGEAFRRNQSDLDRLATKGLPNLAKQFVKVNFPAIAAGQERIARATNGIARGVGAWVNSARGQELIRTITEGTATAVERLAPKATALAIAFGEMSRRAGGGAFPRLGTLLGAAADQAKRFMDSITSQDIATAWQRVDTLVASLQRLPAVLASVRSQLQQGVAWWRANQDAIDAARNALAVTAVVAGLATGGWMIALGGALTLLGMYWGDLRTGIEQAVGWFRRVYAASPAAQEAVARLGAAGRELGAAFMGAYRQVKPTIGPWLASMKDLIRDLLPAINVVLPVISRLAAVAIKATGESLAGFIALSTGVARVVGFMARQWTNFAADVARAMRIVLNTTAAALDGVGGAMARLPGEFGKMGRDMQTAAGKIRETARGIQASIDGIHGKTVNVNVKTTYSNVGGTGKGGASAGTRVGMRAQGGPVMRGRPYVVGEREPELFVPNQSGRILNGRQARGAAGGGDVHVHVHAQVVKSDRELRDVVVGALVEADRRGVKLPKLRMAT